MGKGNMVFQQGGTKQTGVTNGTVAQSLAAICA
jgi:hypothetical protein